MARDPNRRREEIASIVTNSFVVYLVSLVYPVSLTAEPSISSSEATGSNKSIVMLEPESLQVSYGMGNLTASNASCSSAMV